VDFPKQLVKFSFDRINVILGYFEQKKGVCLSFQFLVEGSMFQVMREPRARMLNG
jgi:hypothetical protein